MPKFRLWIPLLAAVVLRFAVLPFSSVEGLMEPGHVWEYGNVARALLEGRGFCSPFASTQLSAIMPPLYPLLVAFFYKLFGVHTEASLLAVHAFNCLASALACIPLYLIARRSFGERCARISAWVWACFPYGVYFAACWAWSTHLLLLGLLWMLYLAQRMEESSQLSLWAAFGLVAGVTGLLEPVGLTVAPFLMAIALWKRLRRGKAWLAPGVTAAALLFACLTPWLVRNAMVFHRFIPMRDSMGLELWVGNNGKTIHWIDNENHPLKDKDEIALYNSMGEIAYMDMKNLQFHAFIQQHRSWYAWRCVRRAIYLWTGYWSLDPKYLEMEPFDLANIPFASVMLLLTVIGLGFAAISCPGEALRYGVVLFLFPLTYYFSHPYTYYMRPLDPLMVCLACLAVLRLLDLRNRTSKADERGDSTPALLR